MKNTFSKTLPRILFVAQNPFGGAGIAAYRLYKVLHDSGWPVRFLVVQGSLDGTRLWDESDSLFRSVGLWRKFWKAVFFLKNLSRRISNWFWMVWEHRFLVGKNETFEIVTLRRGKAQVHQHTWYRWADIIHLHWTAGFLSSKQKWNEKKWVISLHDCFPFTAVCHFPNDCRAFEKSCHRCPQLDGSRNPAYSRRAFLWKKHGYPADSHIVLHAPSQWIAHEASCSALLGHIPSRVLSNFVPTKTFKPRNMLASRDLLDFPQDKKIALFVAGYVNNARKGFQYVQDLAKSITDLSWLFVIVGGGHIPPLPGNCITLGSISDLRLMSAIYSASNVFISTSIQDNLPSTIIEAQLCGTPVIGFEVGGQPEMIEQGRTGWLNPEICVDSLFLGLQWFEKTKPNREYIQRWAYSRWNEDTLRKQWTEFYRGL